MAKIIPFPVKRPRQRRPRFTATKRSPLTIRLGLPPSLKRESEAALDATIDALTRATDD